MLYYGPKAFIYNKDLNLNYGQPKPNQPTNEISKDNNEKEEGSKCYIRVQEAQNNNVKTC